jgi:transcriptional regulator GlxA family with amidase domain
VPNTLETGVDALVVAVPETAGSALYGMIDVLAAAGNLWETMTGAETERAFIRPKIVSTSLEPFRCGNGIPVFPDLSCVDDPRANAIILPEIWLRPEESLKGRYPELMDWIRRSYTRGANIYSACSGSIMLAETGLLAGKLATSHWGYEGLFREQYPNVQFRPETNIIAGDANGRIVTAGGTTSWHDLAIHIISRHCSPGEALRIAKVYLLKWHNEGQLPYTMLARRNHHADSVVRLCEDLILRGYRNATVVSDVVAAAKIPERTLKRRFKTATGSTLIEHVQRVRIEEAKRILENTSTPVEEISAEVGYEEPGFFRRLFKRHTGLRPGEYRRLFQPIANARVQELHPRSG